MRLILALELLSAAAVATGAGLAAGLWAGLVVGGLFGVLACEWLSARTVVKT